MRVAVVHDYLTQRGGAERTALALARYFDAPLYTSVYQPDLTFSALKDIDVRTTFLQKITPHGRFRLAAPLMAQAFTRLDLSDYDAVVVSTSGFAHHVRHDNGFIYCHTPPRFLHDTPAYFGNKAMAAAAKIALAPVQRLDLKAAGQHLEYRANSALTRERIERIYNKRVPVLHPPMRDRSTDVAPLPSTPRALVVARLQPYKRVDIAIRACKAAGIPLTIVGTGRSDAELKAMADDSVTFAGRVTDAELDHLFDTHSVMLATGIEDFGLLPIEANAAGRPVIARAAGGALETVHHGVNGLLVRGSKIDDWVQALRDVADKPWEPESLRNHVAGYEADAFGAEVERWIKNRG